MLKVVLLSSKGLMEVELKCFNQYFQVIDTFVFSRLFKSEMNFSLIPKQYPDGYWLNIQNQRKFLKEFALQHNIKCVEDWGNISFKQVPYLFFSFNKV